MCWTEDHTWWERTSVYSKSLENVIKVRIPGWDHPRLGWSQVQSSMASWIMPFKEKNRKRCRSMDREKAHGNGCRASSCQHPLEAWREACSQFALRASWRNQVDWHFDVEVLAPPNSDLCAFVCLWRKAADPCLWNSDTNVGRKKGTEEIVLERVVCEVKINAEGMKDAMKPRVAVCVYVWLWEEPDKRERDRGDLGLNAWLCLHEHLHSLWEMMSCQFAHSIRFWKDLKDYNIQHSNISQ